MEGRDGRWEITETGRTRWEGRNVRLGWGERANAHLAASQARSTFFTALDTIVPEVQEDLVTYVFPVFRRLFQTVTGWDGGEPREDGLDTYNQLQGRWSSFCFSLRRPADPICFLPWNGLVAGVEEHPELAPLADALLPWATCWHLTEDWCLDIALNTLLQGVRNDFWLPGPGRVHPTGWCFSSVTFPQPQGALPGFTFHVLEKTHLPPDPGNGICTPSPIGAYSPITETRSEARERLLLSFAAELEQYLDQVEARYPSCARTVLKQQRSHFAWVAGYQCLELSFRAIAEEAQYSREGVAGAVRQLAAFMGLGLRRPQRGRPRGSKDRAPRHRAR
jgi:hypothetical protein